MNAVAPKIGFDRFIKGDWATMAIDVRLGRAEPGDLMAVLEAEGLSAAARKKTRTVLNRLWLEPREELVDFVDRGAKLLKEADSPSVLHWGVSISAYPFFAQVSEIVGRLTSIQGACTPNEVHRRMSERYGEREGTYRMTNAVLQTQINWGALNRSDKRLVSASPRALVDRKLVAWLLEATIRAAGRPILMSGINGLPVIYPFVIASSAAYSVQENRHLQITSSGGGKELIGLA